MHSKQNKVRSSSQISNLSGNESQDWIYDCRFCNIKGLKVVKKWKIASFLKEEDFFGPRQNFANANKQFSNLPWHLRWHLLFADQHCKGYYRQCVSFVILKQILKLQYSCFAEENNYCKNFLFSSRKGECMCKKKIGGCK